MDATCLVGSEGRVCPWLWCWVLVAEGVSEVGTCGGQMCSWLGWGRPRAPRFQAP